MRKERFLETLDEALLEEGFVKEERREIVEDYQALIEEAVERGEDVEAFIRKLGTMNEILKQLQRSRQKRSSSGEKWIAVSPFVALILFFILGLGFDAWHPGWLSFFLVPMVAILMESRGVEKWLAVSPFLITTVFMLVGTYTGLWDPYWSLYVLIIAFALTTSDNRTIKTMSVVPLLSVVLYIVLFYTQPQWAWWLRLLVFLPVLPLVFFTNVIDVRFQGEKVGVWFVFKQPTFWLGLGAFLLTSALYLGLVWLSGLWHPTWLIFLILPVGGLLYAQVIRKETVHLVAYMPFIALTIFFLVGHFLGGYAYSWLAFLLIPIVAILTDQTDDER